MKEIKTTQAVGHVLCHDITQIIVGQKKGVAFSKGHVVQEEDIPVLLSIGKEHLYVWEKTEGFLHENEAAEILYSLCAGNQSSMRASEVKEGKIDVLANHDGFMTVDLDGLKKINSLGEMMIATRHSNSPVKKNDKLAGTRIIPLLIEESKMKVAQEQLNSQPLLKLFPYYPKKVGIVTTGSEISNGLIQDTFTPVLHQKLQEYDNIEILESVFPGDNPEKITQAILSFLEQQVDLVLCTGGMSVDPDDKTPLAIKNASAEVVSYGAPVLPGAMFLLAYTEKGIPVVGLPGCVMYSKRTIFDLILPRIMANIKVSKNDLSSLGNGGLCLSCPSCIFPNCAFGAGV